MQGYRKGGTSTVNTNGSTGDMAGYGGGATNNEVARKAIQLGHDFKHFPMLLSLAQTKQYDHYEHVPYTFTFPILIYPNFRRPFPAIVEVGGMITLQIMRYRKRSKAYI
uniref:DUF1996 domain-containing protein n=1 Tax=Heterorhabditis bacteriophora TaxID=37862 RepID=A0A1I7XEF4_HETBA